MLRRHALMVSLLLAATSQAAATPPRVEDFKVISRAMSFAKGAARSEVRIAIVFDAQDPVSREEAGAAHAILSRGLTVGDVRLSSVELDQDHLGDPGGYDAVLSVSGVDQHALSHFLRASGIPCFTLHVLQVRDGACAVAVRTHPSVGISFNSRNASAAGVSFATAFIMMVQEL